MTAEDISEILSLPHKRSLSEDVVDRLREAIYSGKLAPDVKLREEMLAEFLKVSRGPIREALVQLEREGLVIKEPNRGATVARLSREDLDEVYSLRMALETFAVKEAIRNYNSKMLEEMQVVIDTMTAKHNSGFVSVQDAAILDVEFHEIIYMASGHKRLYTFWSMLRPQIHIFLLSRNVANPDYNFRENIIDSHQAILDAIRDRNEALATKILEGHLRAAYERIVKSYHSSDSTGEKPG